MKHRVQVSFPAFHLLSVGARVWLPYSVLDERMHNAMIALYDSGLFFYEASFGYPIILPQPARCIFSWNERGEDTDIVRFHRDMEHAIDEGGRTSLEAVAFVADWQNANMNDLFDRVIIRIRRCTYLLTGVWQESVYELALQQIYLPNPFHDRPTYVQMLDALIWRTGGQEYAQVARLMREADFVEPAIRFEEFGPAKEYLAALVLTSITDIDEKDRQCHICMRAYELPGLDSEPERPTTLDCCGQHVGEDCLRYWFRQVTDIGTPRNTCPFCRANLFLQVPDLRPQRATARNLLPDLRPPEMTAQNLQRFYGIAGEWLESNANRVRPVSNTGPPGSYSLFSNPDVLYTMQHPPRPTDHDHGYISTFQHFRVIAASFNDKPIDPNSWSAALSKRSQKVQRMRRRSCNGEPTTPGIYPQTLRGVPLTGNFSLASRAFVFAYRKTRGLPGAEKDETSWLGYRFVGERTLPST